MKENTCGRACDIEFAVFITVVLDGILSWDLGFWIILICDNENGFCFLNSLASLI